MFHKKIKTMKTDIILAGVGGQGILTIAATIGTSALASNLKLKQSEVHGMSQRGGEVVSHMRLSSDEIASDLIPKGSADVIIAVEPMESLRYLDYLKPNGWLVTNSKPYLNIPNYPDIDELLKRVQSLDNHIIIDADAIAKKIRSPRSSNIVVLGAATPFIDMPYETLEEALRVLFNRKGEKVVNANLEALKLGREFTETNR